MSSVVAYYRILLFGFINNLSGVNQKSELTVAEAKAVINGAVVESAEGNSASGDSSAMQAAIQCLTGELEEAKKKTQQKDEEVKLYRGKLDESTKQMTLLVS